MNSGYLKAWIGAVALVFIFAVPLQARAEKLIEWTNLLPKAEPLKDPMSHLTLDQRFDIENIIWARSLTAGSREITENRQAIEDAEKYERRFKEAGIDVDKLIQDYSVWMQEIEKRQSQVNKSLNGKNIKLAGYLLPIEFSEQGVKDFLLVPTIGACVHVPPPPPNQIVYVRLAKKKVVKDLFTPVWIKGRIQTQLSNKALNLSDGSRDVRIGYSMNGASYEPYKAQ